MPRNHAPQHHQRHADKGGKSISLLLHAEEVCLDGQPPQGSGGKRPDLAALPL